LADDPIAGRPLLRLRLPRASRTKRERRVTFGRIGLGIALAAVLTACDAVSPAATGPTRAPDTESPSPSPPAAVRVAFVQDLSAEGALDRTLPAFQAVELAFSNAAIDDDTTVAVELVAFDVAGDPAAAQAAADDIAADPDYVAAIAAPYLGGQQALTRALGDVPLLSLSARGGVPDSEPGTWIRFVAPLRDQALALADVVASRPTSRSGVCVAPATADAGFNRALRRALEPRIDVTDALDTVDVLESGCGTVAWTRDGIVGARLALDLDGTRIAVVGRSGLLAPDFIQDAGRSAEGVLSICSCADVSISLDLAAQRFIQDYQSEYGSPPGAFAVEAWDAAHMLLRALRRPTPSRTRVAAWIAETSVFDGLGGTYRFEGGELADPGVSIRIYRVEGGRWILVEGRGEAVEETSQA
jgi:ABC-type branched-subunit amino acid transport system substrate-binding protein